ncbi:hypothetical protein DMN91_007959 [Ooceraea biroi]|uniref:MADF domain-containing protein n=1 Tax=Ooceraea biroi TaxID=2015173 RepID=A0A3L8DGU9_OOCBI|nr:hypothetical protein DMN91_007959 [Ooceraea biroi]
MSGEDEFEDELDDKELISCVKANPLLYDKSEKFYSNSEVKRLIWEDIGNNLTNKKTGTTISNYKRKESTSKAIVQVNLPTPNLPSNSISNASSASNLWNEDLITISCDDVNESSNTVEPLPSVQPSTSSLPRSSSFSAPEDSGISIVEEMQQAINTSKHCVPQSDLFAKRKKQKFDVFSNTMLEQSKNLNVLEQKVGDALTSSPSVSNIDVTEPFNSFRPDVKTMLTSLGFALQKIPESKHLDILISLMQLVKQYIEDDITK